MLCGGELLHRRNHCSSICMGEDIFSKNAAAWWDLEGGFKMLHRMNPTRLTFIKENLGDLTGKRILDYGCGGGLLSESLIREGARVLGMDLSTESIAVAKEHAVFSGLAADYQVGTIDQLDNRYFEQEPFDIVVSLECLEHVQYPERLVASLSSCLKPGGYMVLSTINRNLYAYFFGIVCAEYLLGWVDPGTHVYQDFIKPSELVAMGRDAGLSLHVMQGMVFDVKSQAFFLSDDVTMNYMMLLQKKLAHVPCQG